MLPSLAMMLSRSSAILVLSLAAFGCESKKPESTTSPPSNSTAAAPSTASTTAPAAAAAAKNSFPSPASFDMKPVAVGQWVRMSVNKAGLPPGQAFVRVVGKEGDSFWYEIETNGLEGNSVIQFLMGDATRADFKLVVQKLRMKTPAGTQELSGAALSAFSAIMDKYTKMIGRPNLQNAERADATVPVGEFKGCFIHQFKETVAGIKVEAKSWNHPAVPINGFVRSEGTEDGRKVVTELVEMHMEGAKSAM